jgi:hypothetical protein
MRSSVLLPQPLGPRMVMKSFSATSRSVACSASVRSKRRSTPRTVRMGFMLIVPAAPTGTGAVHPLKARSLTRPMRPMTMMPKMIWSVASSAWLSVIMWPMPLLAPISSATMT